MPNALPTRVHIDPPMREWQVASRNGRAKSVIATGHQPTLWHPGILAKYLAADGFAQRVGGATLNVVVEHNPVGQLAVDVPVPINEVLRVFKITLDARSHAEHTPPNRLGPLSGDMMLGAITRAATAPPHVEGTARVLEDKLATIGEAITDASDQSNLALQTSEALTRLMKPHVTRPLPALPTSRVVTPSFLDRLLADPVGCTRCYNRACLAYPQAGIRPLYLGRDVVEVPLWAQDATTCTPVYVDLGDSKRPQLFTAGHNTHLDLTGPDAIRYLRPRAISLSAIMRAEHCDLFIHGTGGGVYDQVTDRWWEDWTGEELAPSVVVSADVYLPFDVPVATRDELTQAQWFAHHLPHSLDRHTEAHDDAEAVLRSEKRVLLDRMNDDRDKRRRAKAFKRIHAINAELRGKHQPELRDAAQRVRRASVGVSNAAIARRRDWCFALYPETRLQALREMIATV